MNGQELKDQLLVKVPEAFNQQFDASSASMLTSFFQRLVECFPAEDLESRSSDDLYGMTVSSWDFLSSARADQADLHIFNPDFAADGWASRHSIILLSVPNMPFVMDSVRGALNRQQLSVHTLFQLDMQLQRSKSDIKEVHFAGSEVQRKAEKNTSKELLLYLEIDRLTAKADIDNISKELFEIIAEVGAVSGDYSKMLDKTKLAIVDIAACPSIDESLIEEHQAFIGWLIQDHFTFLGYEELVFEGNGDATVIKQVKGSALGLLSRNTTYQDDYRCINHTLSFSAPIAVEDVIRFAKATTRSRVHRFVYPDYISISRYDNKGNIIGEHRFLGLYTARVFSSSPASIPLLRKKIAVVMDRSGYVSTSHEGRTLERLLEIYPREELFLSDINYLCETSLAINNIQERRQVRVFTRLDESQQFVNCLVYLPRDMYNTQLRQTLQALLCELFSATESEFTTFFSESILVRTHFVLRTESVDNSSIDPDLVEQRVREATMGWTDFLQNYLIQECGEELGASYSKRYKNAFPAGYREDFDPRIAVMDIGKIETLKKDEDIAMSFYRSSTGADGEFLFRLFHQNVPLALSDVMPILENLGLRVVSERPFAISPQGAAKVWVHEFTLIYGIKADIEFDKVEHIFQEAFSKIWYAETESDLFNRLILGAQIGWREVAMLRAYAHYMKQLNFNFSLEYIAETLSTHFAIAGALVDYFFIRFDPKLPDTPEQREARDRSNQESLLSLLESVENLNEDTIVRHYMTLIAATLRTNYFQSDEDTELKTYFSFKMKPDLIPGIPLPLPAFEIYVYSPWVEGVHLRGGKVARGGLRWSDRHEDYRTEVLGLVKAQQVKNSVIVPTGAKGGFINRKPLLDADREAFLAQGVNCYKTFIQALLDVTDNLVDGETVPPSQVVCKDDADPYLVVAADKGTATFSDIANGIAQANGFWLGDAFASGGSVGYDHKKMGITAKGAWVSVERHFREMGINTRTDEFSVVGIGDMSGDVFGNGMLLSDKICLVAAFNHEHIFIDPSPNSATSFKERSRLFELARSSWSDYNLDLISEGGGIFKRSAKSIELTPQIKERFAIGKDSLTPTDLIKSILASEFDLLWNGGIGTYVKASSEQHVDVGDKANDGLRINANDLRCRVIGEGGNLGITQLARVEYSLLGGRCNTDFIDNAAGVDCSDHEVNIKILLNNLMQDDQLTGSQRNQRLEDMTETVSSLVLENNYIQTEAISIAEHDVLLRTGEYRRLIDELESSGRLNRDLEFIPSDEQIVERKASGVGLTRPELSVLLSYAKNQLKETLVDTPLVHDEVLMEKVFTAFPDVLVNDYRDALLRHPLRAEIVSTQLANDVVNTMGIAFVNRMVQSTGVSIADVVSAYSISVEVFSLRNYWQQIQSLDYVVDTPTQLKMMAVLMRLVRRGTRWFIRNRRSSLSPGVEIPVFSGSIKLLSGHLGNIVTGELRDQWQSRKQAYVEKQVPEELADFIAAAPLLYPCLGIVEASKHLAFPELKVSEVFFALSQELDLDWFAGQISNLKVENYWQAMARESYRDDLEWQLRNLTVAAIRYLDDDGNVDECISKWTEDQQLMISRWRLMLEELHAAEGQDFAMYSVAIRELLDMAQSTKFGE